MITDARALDVDAVPSEILRRNAELNALSNALEPLLDGDRGDHSLVFGEPGTGKTACARYTLDNLERELVDVRTKYVNCFRHHSKFAILYSLVDGVGGAMDIKPHSTPHDKLYQRLRDADDKPYVVILDEVDQLDAKDEVLYELLSQRHIYLIAIANKPDQLMQRLDDRVASRLRGRTPIEFDPYPTDELVAILEKRAEHGLRPGAVADGVLEEIAESAAGNARVAIQTLREAALEAEREGSQITSAYVTHAEPRAREQLREKTISKLNRHQRIVYDVLGERPGHRWSMGEIYEAYSDQVDDPRTRKTVSNYLRKMQYYNLVEMEGEKRGRRYWRK
jgi:cell division control protein 6